MPAASPAIESPEHQRRRANFARFWAGQTSAQFCSRLAAVAMPVMAVSLLHASPAQLGVLNACSTAAFLLVGLPAGALVDRWLKKRTLLAADAVRLVAALAIPVLWLTGGLAVWHLYLVAAVIGLASVFFDVAYQSYLPVLVAGDEIAGANARLETTAQLATTAGPALGGLAMRVVAAPVVMLADALGYALSVAFLLATHDDERALRDAQPADTDSRSLVHEIAEGAGFVWRHPVLRRVSASTALANVFATIVSTLFPLLVLRILGLPPVVLGLVLTCGSAGGAIGAAATPWLRRHLRVSQLVVATNLVATLSYLGNPVAALLGPGHRPAAVLLLCLASWAPEPGCWPTTSPR